MDPRQKTATQARQHGGVLVEMAVALPIFLLLLFLLTELGRALYLFNAVQEVTRQAARLASVTSYADPAAMEEVRRRAMFGLAGGKLPMGGGIDGSYLHFDYLSLNAANQALPVDTTGLTPAQNVVNCAANYRAANCIRFVQVRLCQPGAGAACTPIPYTPLLPLAAPFFSGLTVPSGVTMTPAESLGARP